MVPYLEGFAGRLPRPPSRVRSLEHLDSVARVLPFARVSLCVDLDDPLGDLRRLASSPSLGSVVHVSIQSCDTLAR